MVMPRSRSIGFESSTCASISRSCRPPQSWMMRSAKVDLPWSIWAMIEKLRMNRIESCCMETRLWGCDGSGFAACLGLARHYRTAPSVPRRHGRMISLPVSVPGRIDRHVLGTAATPHQQHHGLARARGAQLGIQRCCTRHVIPTHCQDHVAGTHARLARGHAFDARNQDALAHLQAQSAALLRIEVFADDTERIRLGGGGRTRRAAFVVRGRSGRGLTELVEGGGHGAWLAVTD